MKIILCPECGSENVILQMADSNEFVCNDCGEDFESENGTEIEDETGNIEAGFININPQVALSMAQHLKKKDDE